jgi:hypothetical protein
LTPHRAMPRTADESLTRVGTWRMRPLLHTAGRDMMIN